MFKFCIVRIKNFILPLMFLAFTLCLIVFSKSNLFAAKNGLALFANSVIPSLFPFFVATELLSYTNITKILGKFFNRFMKPLFNVRGEGSFALIMGILSGYPVGAKIVCDLRKNNICSKEECERLLSFTNNSGPLFIIATVGVSLFGSSAIGFLLLITHILSSLTVGFLFRFWKYNKTSSNVSLSTNSSSLKTKVSFSKLGEIISNSINNSISTLLTIGGFVVLFSVIISIIQNSNILSFVEVFIPSKFTSPLILGLLEITNGISLVTAIPVKKLSITIIMVAFLLGFGGFSVLLQVWSIVSKSDLSLKPYFLGKCFQACFAAFYTYIFIYVFPFFNFNL
ncbi:MAG: sporulation integral membrane protein YlbJ [Clostridia bacterium]|nr:sporulation integral membrane protein YlbJ [Clostridia bacterium]